MPLLAVVDELKKLSNVCNEAPQLYGTMEPANGKLEFLLLTSDSEFNKAVSDAGIQIKIIKTGKLRRYFSWENFVDIFRIPVGIIQSLYHIHKFNPDIVFSKGGFASIPPVVAARILGIPIITHESDIIPGLANKIIAYFSSKIFISFSDTEKYFNKNKIVLVGNPVRGDITKGNRENALKFFNLCSDLPVILIFGGSQGAQKINEMILDILPELVKKCQIIHQCGTKNLEKTKKVFKNLYFPKRYKLYSFLNKEMKDAYAVADLIISRAGANSISEVAVLGKPNILIPLSISAGNHQFKNAEFFVEKGASLMIDETVSSSDDLLNCIFKILANKNLQDKMKNALQDLSPQNSARKIAEEIIRIKHAKS